MSGFKCVIWFWQEKSCCDILIPAFMGTGREGRGSFVINNCMTGGYWIMFWNLSQLQGCNQRASCKLLNCSRGRGSCFLCHVSVWTFKLLAGPKNASIYTLQFLFILNTISHWIAAVIWAYMLCASLFINPEPHVPTASVYDLCTEQKSMSVLSELRIGTATAHTKYLCKMWLCKKLM
jgi:hypothetical protein